MQLVCIDLCKRCHPTDTVLRLAAEKMSTNKGQPINQENIVLPNMTTFICRSLNFKSGVGRRAVERCMFILHMLWQIFTQLVLPSLGKYLFWGMQGKNFFSVIRIWVYLPNYIWFPEYAQISI